MALRELERVNNEDEAILSNSFEIDDDTDGQESVEKPSKKEDSGDESQPTLFDT